MSCLPAFVCGRPFLKHHNKMRCVFIALIFCIDHSSTTKSLPRLEYGPRRKEIALSFHFKAGLANQLISFQKTACEALSSNTKLLRPSIFNCDKTNPIEIDKTCNTSNSLFLSDIFVISKRVNAITVTDAEEVQFVQDPFYTKDRCEVKANELPDIMSVLPEVVSYGESLLNALNVIEGQYISVQFRTGKDWERHDKAFKNAYKHPTRIMQSVNERGLPCILLTPESTKESVKMLPCRRVNHDTNVHPLIRLVSEYVIASKSKMFYYNFHSTMQHIVRRISNTTKLIDIK